MLEPSKASTAQTFDVREDEEQQEKQVELINLLISAGYYRAKIQGLTSFDKIVGGMVWCISLCSERVNVDLLYSENSTIGQKIALTENIVKVLPNFKCPHSLEPHQIQGLDCIHILPVMKWLVKEAIEAKKRTGDNVLNHSVYQFEHGGWKLPRSLEPAVKEVEETASNSVLKRMFRRKKDMGNLSVSEDVKCTLMEYGHEASDVVVLPELDEEDEQVKNKEKIIRKNLEVTEKIKSELQDFEPSVGRKSGEELQLELTQLQKERDSLRKEQQEEEVKLESMKREADRLRESYEHKQAVLSQVNPEKLEEIKTLLDKVRDTRKEYKQYKRDCKRIIADKQARNDALNEAEVGDTSVIEKEEQQELLALSDQLMNIDDESNSANQKLYRLRCQYDANPSQLEKNQYQKRFVELHNHMSSTHREIKGLYNLHNMNVDIKNFIKKEIDLLNNIDDLKDKAVQDAYRDSFVQNLDEKLKSIEVSLNKMTEKKEDLQKRKDKLYDDLQLVVDKQRIYNNTLAQFQAACLKNQQLREKNKSRNS